MRRARRRGWAAVRDIELGWPESDEDRERLTEDWFQAITEVVEFGGVTLLTIDGEPVAGIAPVSQIMQERADTVTIPRGDLTTLLAAAAALAGNGPVPELLHPLVDDVLSRYRVRLDVTP